MAVNPWPANGSNVRMLVRRALDTVRTGVRYGYESGMLNGGIAEFKRFEFGREAGLMCCGVEGAGIARGEEDIREGMVEYPLRGTTSWCGEGGALAAEKYCGINGFMRV